MPFQKTNSSFKNSEIAWPTSCGIVALFWGMYQVDVLRLQMVITGYVYNCHHSTVNISNGKSDPCVAYLYRLLDVLLVSM